MPNLATATAIRLGSTPVSKIYLGAQQVWPAVATNYASLALGYSPLLYWRLNDTSGTTAVDSSGNGRNGTYVAAPSLAQDSLLADGDGAGVYFDHGLNNGVSLADAPWMDVGQMTITCVYLSNSAEIGLQMLASRYADDISDYSWWVYRENNVFKLGYRSSGGQTTVISSGISEQLGQTYYIAAYAGAGGAGIRVYSLGVLLGSATGAAYAVASSSGSFAVASSDVVGYTLTGTLQEVAYFGTILTTNDLDALAAQATTPQPQWLQRTAGVAARNGASNHALTFPATTNGSLLVAVVSGAVVSTAVTAGWTKRLNPVFDCEVAVFTHTANAGETDLQLSCSASNYPLNYVVYEFPVGTSWVAGNSEPNGHVPSLAGLPGTPVTVFAGFTMGSSSPGDPTASTIWGWNWVESYDTMTISNGVTDGAYTTVGWRPHVTATSISPATEGFFGPVYTITNPFNNRTSVVFALNIP